MYCTMLFWLSLKYNSKKKTEKREKEGQNSLWSRVHAMEGAPNFLLASWCHIFQGLLSTTFFMVVYAFVLLGQSVKEAKYIPCGIFLDVVLKLWVV